MSWASVQPGRGWQRKPRVIFLLSPPHASAGRPVIFSGKPLSGDGVFERRDCHGSTKPTEIQKLACFSCRQTATWELTDEYVGILEILLERAYQSGLLKSGLLKWLEAPPCTAPLPMVNCCHCQSTGESGIHAPAPGTKC